MSGWDVPHLMTLEEVAKHLGTDGDAVNRLRRKGDLVGVKVGAGYRYHPADVRAYIDRQREGRES